MADPFELSNLVFLANAGLYWLFFRRRPPDEEGVGAARRTRVTG